MGNNLKKIMSTHNYKEYRSDSYAHRVCDDLSEVILQYLSLKDKLRLECVSTQFKRTIFQRHYELRVDYTTRALIKKMTIKSFESVLQKCPNITSIYLTNNFRFLRNRTIGYNDWIECITENCRYLAKINLDFFLIQTHVLEQFINKFGPRLKYFDCPNVPCSKLLTTFTNIQVLNLNVCNYYDIQEHKFAKLSKLTVYLYNENCAHLMSLIQFNPGIKSLCLRININDQFFVNSLFVELSMLKNLTHVTYTEFPLNDELFDRALTKMAVNCPQLKSIGCLLKCYSNNYYKINELLSPLKRFKHLKRLDLCFMLSISEDQTLNSVDFSDYFIRPLTGLEGLTELCLTFYGYSTDIIEKIIINFVINLPKLQFLEIRSHFRPIKRTAAILSQLSKIEFIKLHLSGNYEQYKIKEIILKSCKNIKSILISS